MIASPCGSTVDLRTDRGAFEEGAGAVGLGAFDLQHQRRARQQLGDRSLADDLPRSTMATASQVRSTSSRRCEDSTTVRPSATSERIMSRMSCMPAGSRPFIGSSRISSCGIAEQAGGDAETLAHAHRVLRHPVIGAVGHADPLEGRADAVPRRGLARGGENLQVLAPGQMAVETGLVDDRADPGQRHVAMFRDGVPEQRHRAGIGVGQSQQHPDQRGLAGAVGTEVAERAPAGDEELHAVDGDVVPEPLRQPVGLDRPATVSRSLRGTGRNACRSHRIHRPAD